MTAEEAGNSRATRTGHCRSEASGSRVWSADAVGRLSAAALALGQVASFEVAVKASSPARHSRRSWHARSRMHNMRAKERRIAERGVDFRFSFEKHQESPAFHFSSSACCECGGCSSTGGINAQGMRKKAGSAGDMPRLARGKKRSVAPFPCFTVRV